MGKIAYFIFEGETEDEFYKSLLNKYLDRSIERKYKNLGTGTGINKTIASHLYTFIQSNADKHIYTYVFIDREGPRSKVPEFNEKAIINELGKHIAIDNLQKIAKVEAIQMIESWFFYDIETICKHIGLPCSTSIRTSYSNPEMLTCKDLSGLFKKGTKNRYYKKGDSSFLNKLNADKIYEKCKDLRDGIVMINNDFRIEE